MKTEITFNDFEKLDIRIGEVVAAERVPGSDKLLACTVHFGDNIGERTIVSGIAEHISAERLVGMKLPYIVNLAPRTIRGIESQGMLLAVGGETFSFLLPLADVPRGSACR